jgi:hypothetical protein
MAARPNLKFHDYWIIFVRIIAIGIVLTGISVGAKQTYVGLSASQVLGAEVDADLKLAALGFFNKSLDVLLVSSLEYTASFILTIWMAWPHSGIKPSAGATFSDFGLKDELTKPWMTIVSFITRCGRSKWSWASFLRCLMCLCVSISVMLQGLAVNTVAIPKKRWYPDPSSASRWSSATRDRKTMTVQYPKVLLREIDWLNLLGIGQANVGRESYPPWDWALGVSASQSLLGLSNVVPTVSRSDKGWQLVWGTDKEGRQTGLHTQFDHSDRPIETISVDDEQVLSVFDWLRKMHHQPTASSIGWTGNLTLVLPALNTICTPANSSITEALINVTLPDSTSSSSATFGIDFGPIPSLNFTGAACYSTFRQGLYPLNVWIVEMQGADLSFNSYGTEWNQPIIYEPITPNDHSIARALAIQTRDSMPRMETLVPSTGLLAQFLLMSRMLQQTDPAITSDTTGLSVVLGVLLQNLINTSNKYWSPLPPSLPSEPSDRITSYPLQWQLYGSGPRLAWEWVAVAVLAIVLLSFCAGMYQTLRYWMAPGFWVQLDGMMMIAQKSHQLDDIKDEEKARKRVYRVEHDPNEGLVLKSTSV